jgi:Uncharacterized protein conserved in bacteria (DUF2252)
MKRKRTPDPRDILDMTARYEGWLRRHTSVVEEDLLLKHELMRDSPFVFLRATYYAWATTWPLVFPRESKAPRVAAIGDLHMENFGTWRDAEGRLAWGVNDFDEASILPYTNDLVRLATSAVLASETARLRAPATALARAFREEYCACLRDRDARHPIVLAERHRRFGEKVLRDLVRPSSFWKKKLAEGDAEPRKASGRIQRALRAALPPNTLNVHIRPRVAGVGSLGRPRFVAIGDWNGGRIAREAKALVPSAAVWAGGLRTPPRGEGTFDRLLKASVRSRDPFLHCRNGLVVRRLAPDVDKIEITSLGRGLEVELAALMGREVANVHLATPDAAARIVADLERRPDAWLLDAAHTMAELTTDIHKVWKKASKNGA